MSTVFEQMGRHVCTGLGHAVVRREAGDREVEQLDPKRYVLYSSAL
jgi:hypothetical protein